MAVASQNWNLGCLTRVVPCTNYLKLILLSEQHWYVLAYRRATLQVCSGNQTTKEGKWKYGLEGEGQWKAASLLMAYYLSHSPQCDTLQLCIHLGFCICVNHYWCELIRGFWLSPPIAIVAVSWMLLQ